MSPSLWTICSVVMMSDEEEEEGGMEREGGVGVYRAMNTIT